MTEPHEKFYSQLQTFKDKLEIILRNNNKLTEIEELNEYYDELLLAKRLNMFVPIEIFYKKGVLKFVNEIINKEESFFLRKGDELETELQDDKIMIIEHIKSVWNMLSDVVKNNIWDYVRILCVHAERSCGGSIFVQTLQNKL